MKRTEFKRKQIQRKPVERKRSIPTPGTGRGVHGPSSDVPMAAPKDVKAKPCRGTPTAEEARWMSSIVEYGCIACALDGRWHRPAAVHHILRGGQRIGHLFTIPLCDPGHHQNGQPLGMVSRHPWKARFEAIYGNELDLLALMQHRVRP